MPIPQGLRRLELHRHLLTEPGHIQQIPDCLQVQATLTPIRHRPHRGISNRMMTAISHPRTRRITIIEQMVRLLPKSVRLLRCLFLLYLSAWHQTTTLKGARVVEMQKPQ